MSRYIEADVVKIAMSLYGFSSPDQTITEFVEDILPTADVVEVVRCKDCDCSMGITEKKCPMWENIGDQNGYCKWWQSTTIFHK